MFCKSCKYLEFSTFLSISVAEMCLNLLMSYFFLRYNALLVTNSVKEMLKLVAFLFEPANLLIYNPKPAQACQCCGFGREITPL